MLKFQQLQKILLCLSIIGKDNLSINHNRKSEPISKFLHVFRIIFLLLLISSVLKPFHDNNSFKSLSLYAVNYLTFNIVIAHTVDIIASWLHTESAASIVTNIEQSLDFLNTFTNLSDRIASFTRHFCRKFFIAFSIFFAEVIVRLIFLSDVLNEYSYTIATVGVFYKNIEIFYVTFYVNVQTFILLTLNDHLNAVAIECENESFIHAVSQCDEKLHILHRARTIYLHISKISENINIRFGGFLLTICVDTLILLIHSGTSSFDILMKSNNKVDVLRESLLFH